MSPSPPRSQELVGSRRRGPCLIRGEVTWSKYSGLVIGLGVSSKTNRKQMVRMGYDCHDWRPLIFAMVQSPPVSPNVPQTGGGVNQGQRPRASRTPGFPHAGGGEPIVMTPPGVNADVKMSEIGEVKLTHHRIVASSKDLWGEVKCSEVATSG